MDQQARATEHVAAGIDSNVSRSHSAAHAQDIDEKAGISEHIEDPTIDPIAALNDPDFAAKEKALVRRLDMTFIPCLWILYFHNYLDRSVVEVLTTGSIVDLDSYYEQKQYRSSTP